MGGDCNEASSHDQIKMTKLWLEYDQKIFKPTIINIGTWLKNSQRRTLTIEHDHKIFFLVMFIMFMFVDANFPVIFTNFGHIHLGGGYKRSEVVLS